MMLAVRKVSKSFGTKRVLDNLSFEVAPNEFVSLIGPSGSGKSTLFHLIGGLLAPDSGQILMHNEVITNESGHISYMPQQASLFPWRTILNNVLLGQELHGVRDEERAIDMLQKAGLSEVIHAYPHELSGGMQQRVAFIRALLSPQPLLCLDEPFSALDEFTRLEMQKWLLATWEQSRRSVLFITHNIEEALYLSDRIIVLSAPPATIKQTFTIPFPRPRTDEIIFTELFFEWKKQVVNAIETTTVF